MKRTIKFFCVLVSLAVLATDISVRLMHSHLTETELFLQYWYVWVLSAVLAVFALLLFERVEKW